mgnify:CR=1 FL=1
MHLQTEERARLRKKSLTYDKDDTTLYAAPVIKNTDDDLDERGSLLRGLVSDTDSDGVEDRDLLLPAEFHTSCSGLFVLKKLSSLSLSLSLSHTHISISHSLSLSHLYLSIYLSSIYLSAYLSVCLDLSLFPSFPDMFSSCSLFLTYALFYSCGTNGWRVLNSTVGSGFHSISEVDSSLRLHDICWWCTIGYEGGLQKEIERNRRTLFLLPDDYHYQLNIYSLLSLLQHNFSFFVLRMIALCVYRG